MTLGGALLEQSHVIGTDGPSDTRAGGMATPTAESTPTPVDSTPKRPKVEARATTEIGLGESPSILSADQVDPLSVSLKKSTPICDEASTNKVQLLLRSHSG